MWYESQQFFEVGGAPAGPLAFDVYARLAGALLLDEVQCDATQDCKVLGAVAGADAAVVFAESHVQHPVAAILNAPVGADGGIESVGAECKAADVVAPFDAALTLAFAVDHLAGAVNADHAAQSRPWQAVLGQGLQIVGHRAASALHAAVPLVHTGMLLQWCGRRVRVVGVKQLLDRLRERGLVVLDSDDVVGLPGDDLFHHRALATHGVDGDDGALNVQRVQQLGDGGDFVALGRRLHLRQYQALLGVPSRNQMGHAELTVVRAAHTLAVNGYELLRQVRTQRLGPAYEASLKALGIQQTEHLRISVIVDARFSLIVDGETASSSPRRGGVQVPGRNVAQPSTISLKRPPARAYRGWFWG